MRFGHAGSDLRIDAGGLGLHLSRWGKEGGPRVLFLHGMAGNTHWWDLAASSVPFFDAAALDFRGHGHSDRSESYSIADFVSDIEAVRKALGWEHFHLVGHSLGGRCALQYAAEQPGRLLGVAAVDFLPEYKEGRSPRFEKAARRIQPVEADAATLVARFRLEPPGTLLREDELRELARHCVKAVPGGFTWRFDWKALTFSYPPVWPVLPKVSVPALVVRGEHSEVLPRQDMERVVAGLPDGRGVEVPTAHHHVPLDAPEALAELLLEFIKR